MSTREWVQHSEEMADGERRQARAAAAGKHSDDFSSASNVRFVAGNSVAQKCDRNAPKEESGRGNRGAMILTRGAKQIDAQGIQ